MMNTTTLQQSWRSWMSHEVAPAGPTWLQYLWTALFAMLVAAGFTIAGFAMFASGEGAWRNLTGWAEWYGRYLVVSLSIGFTIHAFFNAGKRWIGIAVIRALPTWQRLLYFSGVPLTGVALGGLLGAVLLGANPLRWQLGGDANTVVGMVLLSVLLSLLFTTYFSVRQRQLSAERRAAQAQLRLLQAQIEPHFLFNTLANVLGLMDADAPRAKLMLESLTDYLRASLGALRQDEQTLGDELALVEAYLSIVKIRMDDRLHYRIDVPDALRAQTLPGLSLQPLVENAVVHGLEPKIAGGSIAIDAHVAAGSLIVRITDDGLGLGAAGSSTRHGTGTALANIRERLAQAFGERGRLLVEPHLPHGVRATLSVPTPP